MMMNAEMESETKRSRTQTARTGTARLLGGESVSARVGREMSVSCISVAIVYGGRLCAKGWPLGFRTCRHLDPNEFIIPVGGFSTCPFCNGCTLPAPRSPGYN